MGGSGCGGGGVWCGRVRAVRDLGRVWADARAAVAGHHLQERLDGYQQGDVQYTTKKNDMRTPSPYKGMGWFVNLSVPSK